MVEAGAGLLKHLGEDTLKEAYGSDSGVAVYAYNKRKFYGLESYGAQSRKLVPYSDLKDLSEEDLFSQDFKIIIKNGLLVVCENKPGEYWWKYPSGTRMSYDPEHEAKELLLAFFVTVGPTPSKAAK